VHGSGASKIETSRWVSGYDLCSTRRTSLKLEGTEQDTVFMFGTAVDQGVQNKLYGRNHKRIRC